MEDLQKRSIRAAAEAAAATAAAAADQKGSSDEGGDDSKTIARTLEFLMGLRSFASARGMSAAATAAVEAAEEAVRRAARPTSELIRCCRTHG